LEQRQLNIKNMKVTKFKTIVIMSVWVVFSSCTNGAQNRKPTNLEGKSDVYKMLYYASLAGSSHNTQPWKVEVSGDSLIQLYADTTRALSVVDPEHRELNMSLGAFIENLTLAAGGLGYNTNIKLNDDKTNNILVAEIQVNKAPTTHYNLELIEKRRTLRTPFDTTSISEKDINKLRAPDSQHIHFFSSHSKEGDFIAQKTLEGYTQEAYNEAAQNELVKWLRFSDKDVNEKKDGLTTAGMQIDGISGFFVRHFVKPEDTKKEMFVKGGIDKTKDQVMNCGGWIVITSSKNGFEEWIQTGRLYEHIHLTCTQLQIGFQPMNQAIQETILKKRVAKELGISDELLFIARVGYVAKTPTAVSPRRPVEAFTTFEK
jgi:hypothetical protein